MAERPEIDRWIISNLHSLIETSGAAWERFDPATACQAAEAFIDDLSNWYIRRNRRRFWRGQSEGDTDKLAAYQTLHEVLATLAKLLAPAIPFLSERIYQNLVKSWDSEAPQSVHLCRFPQANQELKDEALAEGTAVAQRVVAMGHKLREEASLRVRQPLAELRFAAPAETAEGIVRLKDVIAEELNIKAIVPAENLDDLVSYTYKPNLKTLGPKYGKRLAAIRKELPELTDEELAPLRRGSNVTVTIGGEPLELSPEDVMVGTAQAADWVTAADGAIQIALSIQLTPELIQEGLARDFIRQIQQMRKDAGLEIEDRIAVQFTGQGSAQKAISAFSESIKAETLCDSLEQVSSLPEGAQLRLGEQTIVVSLRKNA